MSIRASLSGELQSAPQTGVRHNTATLLALFRWESVRLARHPFVLLGAAGTYVFLLNHVDGRSPSNVYSGLTSVHALLYAPAVFFAANLMGSRDHRAGDRDMAATTPIRTRARTIALLLATGAPAMLTMALIALAAITYVIWGIEPPRRPPLPDLAVQPLTVLGAGLLGVMIARWFPHRGASTVVMLVLYWGHALVGEQPLPQTAQAFSLLTELQRIDQNGNIIGWFPGSVPWHMGYILCLDAMAAVGALLTTPGPKRLLLATGAAAAAGAAVTGWIQLP